MWLNLANTMKEGTEPKKKRKKKKEKKGLTSRRHFDLSLS